MFFVLLEQGVALLEQGVVLHEVLQIDFVVLRDDAIHEAPALVAAFADEFAVLRTDHDQRNKADMLNEAFVVFFAAAELLLNTAFDAAGDDFLFRGGMVKGVSPLNHSHVFGMRNILTINSVVRGLGEAEVVDGIEQIGLALAIEPDQAVEFIREAEGSFSDILIVEYADFLENHSLRLDV